MARADRPGRGATIVDVAARGIELLVRHIDTNDGSLCADELCEDVAVTPRAAAEIEHACALELRRINETAAVVR